MDSKYYLGYDATCGQCARVADVVRSLVGADVAVLPLASADMRRWRSQALGDKAPWAPTLVHISGDEVDAWTGSALAVQLSRRLGPMRSFQLLRAIGSVERLARQPDRRISRSSFLSGIAGAVGGVLFLAQSARAAAPTGRPDSIADPWLANVEIEDSRALSYDERKTLLHERGAETSVAVGGRLERPSLEVPAVALERLRTLSNGSTLDVLADDDDAVTGVEYTLRGGGTLRTLAAQDRDVTVAIDILQKPGRASRHRMRAFHVDVSESESGEPEGTVSLITTVEDGTEVMQAARGCSSSRQCGSTYCWRCSCTSWDYKCIGVCCGPCAWACKTPWTCVSCAVIWCSYCVSDLGSSCCRSRSCTYRSGKYC